MTHAKAKLVFAGNMRAMREGKKLSAYDKQQFHKAQAVLRGTRKPAMNPKVDSRKFNRAVLMLTTSRPMSKELAMKYVHHFGTSQTAIRQATDAYDAMVETGEKHSRKSNPGKPVLIYQNVDRIYATKKQSHICDDECKKSGHRYFHDFKSKPRMYGLPNGDLLITSRKH